MAERVAVVGASGRVGAAIARDLGGRYEVIEIRRLGDEPPATLAARAVDGADVVVNAAGIAHLERPSSGERRRLTIANVELPLVLADAVLERAVPMIHVSSIKATPEAPSDYGKSKFEAERLLDERCGNRFAALGLTLLIVRPLALLIPPFDAGRLRRLAFLRWWPRSLTPPVAVPALTPGAFLHPIAAGVDDLIERRLDPGVVVHDFQQHDRASLRDVRQAMLRAAGSGREEVR